MAYDILLPDDRHDGPGRRLDVIDGMSSAVQRELRRHGLAGYEPPTMAALLALFEQAPDGFTFFDVGANVGLYAAVCAALFDPGRVVAFEPTPSTAAMARRIMRANRLDVVVEELALGDEPGTAALYLSAKSDASNSLVEGFKEDVGTVEVEVRTLDAYVAATGWPPQVMKVDTETFEPQVIAGGRQVLEQHRPHLVIEVLNRRRHDHGLELTEAMSGLGYHYYRIEAGHPWEPSPAIRGNRATPNHDWLLAPRPLPNGFGATVDRWATALAACTGDTNGRLPLAHTLRSVYRAGGVRGVARGARNRARAALGRAGRQG